MKTNQIKFIGTNGSMGLETNKVYNCEISGIYKNEIFYLRVLPNGPNIPYTLNGFLENWRTVK